LSKLPYILFEASVKRYGFLGHLNDNTLAEVAAGLNTSLAEISGEDPSGLGGLGAVSTSQVANLGMGEHLNVKQKYFRHPTVFKAGNYNLEYMLAMGWVFCKHNKN
jgi:hypothetical protein